MTKPERSLLQSVFDMKCPRCRKGDLFTASSSFNYKQMTEMPDACPVCGQKYLLEPGFYYGAMFISYIICGVTFLAFIAFCMFVLKLSVNMSFVFLIILVAIFFGWIFRISRSIWIHINVKYQKGS